MRQNMIYVEYIQKDVWYKVSTFVNVSYCSYYKFRDFKESKFDLDFVVVIC